MENLSVIAHFDTKQSIQQNVDKAFQFICGNFNIIDSSHNRLKEKLRKLYSYFKLKWEKAHRKESVFESSNNDWLKSEFDIEEFVASENNVKTGSPKKRGPEPKSFLNVNIKS